MPVSWHQVIPSIIDRTVKQKPQSVLDIGIGFGKYGLLLRESLDIPYGRYDKKTWKTRIDGIEAFEGYRNPIHDYVYDKVFYGDALDKIGQLPSYDVVLLIDVLEHFTKEDGVRLLDLLKSHSNKCLIISTPLYPAEQGDYNGNEHERHLSRWSLLDFIGHDFSYQVVPIERNGGQVVCIWPDRKKEAGQMKVSLPGIPASLGETPKRQLSLAYILPHLNLTGGLKMLLEQMKSLRAKGHKITAFRKGREGEPVVPEWYDIELDGQVLVPEKDRWTDHLVGFDAIMAGWVGQLPELAGLRSPLIYWEQGNEWLFGEIPWPQDDTNLRAFASRCYSQPCYLAAVSPTVASILRTKYGREAAFIPNGIDTDFYHPSLTRDEDSILLVGNPTLRFKGHNVAFDALSKAWRAGLRFRVNWVCQVPPRIGKVDFPVTLIVRPSQQVLAQYYRTSTIHLFASWYEGFAMPPLEAMASGTPVVATDCGGIRAYAKPGENMLLAEPGDSDSLAAGLAFLLSHRDAREALSAAGRKTALEFSKENAADSLERYIFSVIEDAK